MDYARYMPTGQIFHANAFSRESAANIAALRNDFECPECENSAFYRRASSSGQSACFGAKHKDGCGMATKPAERTAGGPGNVEDEIHNPGRHVVLDLNFGAPDRVNIDPQDGAPGGRGGGRHFFGPGDRPNARAHRRPMPLLRNLFGAPEFATNDTVYEVPGEEALPAQNFFVRFEVLTPDHFMRVRGLWGLVSNARQRAGDAVYLNTGGRDALSIRIPEGLVAEMMERCGAASLAELRGAQVLVIGFSKQGTSGKILCTPESLDHMAIRRVP